LKLGSEEMTTKQASSLFGRPFMGGMERKGVIATGTEDEVRTAVEGVLSDIPDRFILGADCTVPSETPGAIFERPYRRRILTGGRAVPEASHSFSPAGTRLP
jgi:hypothetical protein